MRLDAALTELTARFAHLSDTPLLEAQVLLAHTLQKPKAWVVAHPEAELSLAEQHAINNYAARRGNGEPLPYLLGHWEFYGLDFLITPAVLIPRPETELLVEHALDWLHRHPTCHRAADIGTGSGCIAIALAVTMPDLQVVATGSSSFELSNTISEPLTGRKSEFYLYPLSVAELLTQETPLEAGRLLERRLRYGMYPGVALADDPAETVLEIAASYLYRDVLEYQSVKSPEVLRRLLQAMALQVGNEVS